MENIILYFFLVLFSVSLMEVYVLLISVTIRTFIKLRRRDVVSNYHKLASIWLVLFGLICIAVAITVPIIGYESPIPILLPFVHCGVFWLISIIQFILSTEYKSRNEYIKTAYPDIWKKLHPWGDRSVNNFADWAFFAGKYDDGKDSKLNDIKLYFVTSGLLIAWPFFIIPVATGIFVGFSIFLETLNS